MSLTLLSPSPSPPPPEPEPEPITVRESCTPRQQELLQYVVTRHHKESLRKWNASKDSTEELPSNFTTTAPSILDWQLSKLKDFCDKNYSKASQELELTADHQKRLKEYRGDEFDLAAFSLTMVTCIRYNYLPGSRNRLMQDLQDTKEKLEKWDQEDPDTLMYY